MARPAKITDEALSEDLKQGLTHLEIANKYGMARSSISFRVGRLRDLVNGKKPRRTLQSAASVWDTRKAVQENYRRALLVLENECKTPTDKVRMLTEVRQYLAFVAHLDASLYSAQETQAFMDEVLDVIEEVDPIAHDKIISRLKERADNQGVSYPREKEARDEASEAGIPGPNHALGSLDPDEGGRANRAADYQI